MAAFKLVNRVQDHHFEAKHLHTFNKMLKFHFSKFFSFYLLPTFVLTSQGFLRKRYWLTLSLLALDL